MNTNVGKTYKKKPDVHKKVRRGNGSGMLARILAGILAVVVLLSSVPLEGLQVYAEESDNEYIPVTGYVSEGNEQDNSDFEESVEKLDIDKSENEEEIIPEIEDEIVYENDDVIESGILSEIQDEEEYIEGYELISESDDENMLEIQSDSPIQSEAEWAAGFFRGSGTFSNPYIIMNADQLQFFNQNYYSWLSAKNSYYALGSDINYSGYEWTPIDTIIGFDGQGYTISNVKIAVDDNEEINQDSIAMFGSVSSLKNLNIDGAEIIDNRTIETNEMYYAVLSGKSSSITNCTVSGDIQLSTSKVYRSIHLSGLTSTNEGIINDCIFAGNFRYLGNSECEKDFIGFAYRNWETISDCINSGTVDSKDGKFKFAGVSNSNFGSIRNCINEAEIQSDNRDRYVYICGIAVNNSGIITDCYNNAKLEGGSVSGIAHSSSGSDEISRCHNNGNLVGYDVSGICGAVGYGTRQSGHIYDCTNRGTLTASNEASGCVNSIGNGEIRRCVNKGKIISIEAAGIINYISPDKDGSVTVSECSNEGDIIGKWDTAGIVGKTISELEKSSLLVENCSNYGTISGSGVAGIVGDVTGGATIAECFNEGKVLGEFSAGGVVNFMGVGVSLLNTIDSPLITRCYNIGEIVSDGPEGYSSVAGGVVADLRGGDIECCYNSGDVTGGHNLGGIVGESNNRLSMAGTDIAISDCYNSGTVIATSKDSCNLGGIVGRTPGTISNEDVYGDYYYKVDNCYNTGSLICEKGGEYLRCGQLFGDYGDFVSVSGCYYSKEFGTHTGYYGLNQEWLNKQGIYGVTTEALKQQSTYKGWDFENIWEMGDAEYPYPVLQAEEVEIPESEWAGTSNHINWEITQDGLLTVSGTGDWEKDALGNPPWVKLAKKINSAVIRLSGTTDISYAFTSCSKLASIDLSDSDFSQVNVAKNILSGCKAISMIKTPINLNCDVQLDWLYTDKLNFYDNKLPKGSTKSITIYKADNYKKVSYYGNLGTGNTILKEQYFIPGKDIDCPNDLVQDGYEFLGWYLNTAHEGIEFFSNANKTNRLKINDNIDLYGDFRKIKDANPKNYCWAANNGKHVAINLDETQFMTTTSEYNHDLARFAIEMATLCYSEDPKNNNSNEVKAALNELGFSRIEHHTYLNCKQNHEDICYGKDKKEIGAYSPYWIASKKIKLNGTETTIVGVFIRGTFAEEWIDNFDPEKGNIHKGFDRSANKVVEGIKDYYANYVTGNSKIIVTGHSRGAASANLVGKKLDDRIITGISDANAYIYTFATPNTAKISESVQKQYKNIFNIVNPEDFVTKVLPSKWGYRRYGITYVLPSSTTDTLSAREVTSGYKGIIYKQYKNNVDEELWKLGYGDDYYFPYDSGMGAVSNYVDSVTKSVKDINEYYCKDLAKGKNLDGYAKLSLQRLYTEMLGYNRSTIKSLEEKSLVVAVAALLEEWGVIGEQTALYFISHQKISPTFEKAHVPEYYLAAMTVIKDYQLMTPRKTLKGIVNCPVDVNIYDSEGDLVGQIIDNEVQTDKTSIAMMVEDDSKTFYLPSSDDFRVELSGNAEGTMDYSLLEMDADTGETKRVYYHDLDIDVTVGAGAKYTQDIVANEEIDTFILRDGEGSEVESTATIEGENLGQLSVETITEGAEGYADSFYNLTPGDFVLLNATETENSIFEGWYDTEGNLLSAENPYGLSVSENMSLFARFKEVPDGLYITTTDEGIYSYNGKAIIPQFKVFDGKTELQLNKDYSVKYKNNINAYTLTEEEEGFSYAKAPTITVTGKGDYSGTIVKTFVIQPIDLSTYSDVVVTDVFVGEDSKGKVQKLKPAVTVMLEGKSVSLKEGKDIQYDYPSEVYKAYISSGVYDITITGIGNYTGTIEPNVKESIVDTTATKLLSKMSITTGTATLSDADYVVGEKAVPVANTIVVKDTKLTSGQQVLTGKYCDSKEEATAAINDQSIIDAGIYYVYYCTNNTVPGNGKIIFMGVKANGYEGTVIKTYKVSGYTLKGFVVEGVDAAYPFTGKEIEPAGKAGEVTLPVDLPFKVCKKGKNGDILSQLVKGVNYKVDYINHVNAGTATIVITGINNYSGVLKKTFKITAKAGTEEKGSMVVEDISSQIYVKTGVKPAVVVKDADTGEVLKLGKDYILTYSNNKKVHSGKAEDDTKKNPAPKVVVKGIKNYSGTVTKLFGIQNSSLSNANISMLVSDVMYKDAPGQCKPAITLYDIDGSKLNVGKDYETAIKYTYGMFTDAEGTATDSIESITIKTKNGKVSGTATRAVGDEVKPEDIVPVNTVISAEVTGKGFYGGTGEEDSTVRKTFRYTAKSISKMKVTVVTQTYIGKQLKPDFSNGDVKVYDGTTPLEGGTDYTIEGYGQNINKGTGKLTIKGKGNYGGYKEVSFKITQKTMGYTITYDRNLEQAKEKFGENVSISGTMKNGTISTGTKLAKCNYKLTDSNRKTYTFVGWCTKPNPVDEKDGHWYSDQETFRMKGLIQMLFGKKQTLYAQWKK